MGRALAGAVYVLATLNWAGAMVLSRDFGCEGGDCTQNELHRMDVSVVLGLIGLTIAAAALLASLFRRSLGLFLLCSHVVVFAINLGIFWGLGDTPWYVIPFAALAASAGFVAVGGHGLAPSRRA